MGLVCATHAAAAAKCVCTRCDTPICADCETDVGGKPYCARCAERLKSRGIGGPGGRATPAVPMMAMAQVSPAPISPGFGGHVAGQVGVCRDHPDQPALDRCVGCAEAFCANCLVEIHGQHYCSSCKTMAVRGQPMMVEEATMPCPEAAEALKYSILSLFCFGFVLGPVAIKKALEAKKMIEANPRLSGSGKATAAIIIGTVSFILNILGLIARVSRH